MTGRDRRPLVRDALVCAGAGAFYLLNTLWLRPRTGGWAGWLLSCYANDLWAGAALCAWADLLLRLGRLPPVRSWHQSVPLLLGCGLVWEVLAPLWKAGAVFDPWDLAAYQIGGIFFLILMNTRVNRGGNS